MPVVILVRVSTAKQEIDRQVSELSAYADAKNYEVVEVCRETISGNTNGDARGGLRRAEALVLAGKVKKVLVHEISRLSRRNSITHQFVETLEDCKVSLYWHAQGIETLLPNGKRNPAAGIMLALLAEMARSEMETLRERIKSGLAEARRKGVKLGRPEGTAMEPDAFRQKHRDILRLLRTGQSIRNAAKITGKGISTVQRVKANTSLITGLSAPWGIAIYGNELFVVNNGNGTIGKYTVAGATINASLVSGLSGAAGIAISEDGMHLFVSNSNINTVGKYTTAGATVNAALISSLHKPYGLAVSGGNVFVANENDGTIGKYTVLGASVNPALISGLSQPVDLASSGGNLYIAEAFAQRISKYTTAGATVNAALVTGLHIPEAIAVLPEMTTPTPTPTPTATATATPTATPTPSAAPAGQLLNISTRMRVLTGDNVLIGGFIITGTDPKKVIIRGIGPSLTGVNGTLSNPTLALHQSNGAVITNDNWKINDQTGQSQEAEIAATTIPPASDFESAIVATLPPGNHTAILAGKNGGTGVGVVEVYDLAPSGASRLANISSRGFVDTDDNVMIGGIIVGGGAGGGSAKVVVRAIGPSLNVNGTPVPGRLADPTLTVINSNGSFIVTNDNWKVNDQTGQSQEAEINATTVPPANDLESALVATLPPDNYTAVVRGKNNTTGIGLVEFYQLP